MYFLIYQRDSFFGWKISQVFSIKEGVSYKIRIDFMVQREIVHGLKYVQKTFRVGIPGAFVGIPDTF